MKRARALVVAVTIALAATATVACDRFVVLAPPLDDAGNAGDGASDGGFVPDAEVVTFDGGSVDAI